MDVLTRSPTRQGERTVIVLTAESLAASSINVAGWRVVIRTYRAAIAAPGLTGQVGGGIGDAPKLRRFCIENKRIVQSFDCRGSSLQQG